MTRLIHIIMISISLFLSFSGYSQDCTIISKANDITPDGLCAPVNLSWEVTYTGVNNLGTPVLFNFNWDDGNPVEIVVPTESSPGTFTATVVHSYPPGGPQCNYNPNVTLEVDGVLCTSSIQEQNVTVWDLDNQNGGQLEITPPVFPICVGNDGSVTFQDASLWNCVPPVELDVPNGYARWTQWIYGTNNGAGNFIGNVEVGGMVQAYPYAGAIDYYTPIVYAPFPPNSISLPCYCPNTAFVGQEFEVTIRNWNYCNPYDDPAIPGPPVDAVNGDNPPIETTAIIVIVDLPDATINPSGPYCANDPAQNLTAATPGGIWSGTGITNPVTGRFNATVAGVGAHTITYTITDGNGCVGIDTETIIVYPNPTSSITSDLGTAVCPSTDIQLDGNPSGGTPPYTHIWLNDVTPLSNTSVENPVFNTATEGQYDISYLVQDQNGCRSTDNITIDVYSVSASPMPLDVCAGADEVIYGNPSGGSGTYVSHTWTGDNIFLDNPLTENPVFNNSVIGTNNLTYTVVDDIGCVGIASVVVTVFDNPLSFAGIDDSICGPSFPLNATPTLGTGTWSLLSGPGSASYSDNQSPVSNVTVDAYGFYGFIWTEVYGPGCTSSDTVLIIFTEQPSAEAGNLDAVCGFEYNLNAVPSVGNGIWTMVSGPGIASFSDSSQAGSAATVSAYGLYQFNWLEDNGRGCTDDDDVVIAFNVQPVAEFAPDTSGCSPLPVSFVNTSTGGTGYQWTFGDGNSSASQNPYHTFVNALGIDIAYTVKLVVYNGACADSTTGTVTVNPIPSVSFISDAVPACSPIDVSFTNSSVGSVLHIWDFGDGSGTLTADNVNHEFVNDTTYIEFFEVSLIGISSNGCPDTATHFVQVYPLPEATINAVPDTACHPAVIHLSSSPFASSYEWDFGDGVNQSAGSMVTHDYYNTGPADVSYTINLIVESPLGCTDNASTNVVIHPKPNAGFSVDTLAGCTPFVLSMVNNSSGAENYFWNYGDGILDTTNQSDPSELQHTYLNSLSNPVQNTITLIVESADGCMDTTAKAITVYPSVVADFIADTAGCSPFTSHFVNQSSGDSLVFLLSFGDGDSSVNPNAFHTYNNSSFVDTIYYYPELIAVSKHGCSDTSALNVWVFPKPQAEFVVDTLSACSPYSFSFSNISSGNNSNLWNMADGNILNLDDSLFTYEFVNNQSAPVFFNVLLDVSNNSGCTDQHNELITLLPGIRAEFSPDTAGCHPLFVSFDNTSSGEDYYAWSLGDGNSSTTESPQHLFTNLTQLDTTYTIELIVSSVYNCSDTAWGEVQVHPKPVAGFAIDTQAVCSPYNLQIENQCIGATTFLWDFGDGSESAESDSLLYHNFSNQTDSPVTYTLHSTIENNYGCSDFHSESLVVNPLIEAEFISDTAGCSPLSLSFLNQTSGSGLNFFWDFGDGMNSTAQSPVHLFQNNSNTEDTTYNVALVAQSVYQFECYDTAFASIKVFPKPVADFYFKETNGCTPFQSEIVNNSVGADLYFWSFGDTQSDTTSDSLLVHLYENLLSTPGQYSASLNISNDFGCSDGQTETITVYPKVTALFSADESGCSPFSTNFMNQSYGAAFYEWNFGDGNSSPNVEPVHTFDNEGFYDTIYQVVLVASSIYGCSDTAGIDVMVYPTPMADFEASPQIQVYPSAIVSVTNQSSPGTWEFYWNFGDGTSSTEQDPSDVVYQNWGEYSISLLVFSDHCSSEIVRQVEIVPAPPIAAFGPDAEGCAPLTVYFENNSQYANQYVWSFGDGFTSSQENPVHTFYDPGLFTVTLMVSGPGGQDVASDVVVEVYKVPQAYFTVGPRLVYLPDQPVHCYNLSQDADYWIWNFGDGNSSEEHSPIHYYTAEGLYDISLVVSTENGCTDSLMLEKAVQAEKSGEIIFPNAFTPNLSGANGGEYVQGDYSNDVFYPVQKGIDDYQLQIFNRWGELIFESFDVNIGWDGYYRGELCKQDVYVWKVKGRYINGQDFIQVGDVTLLR